VRLINFFKETVKIITSLLRKNSGPRVDYTAGDVYNQANNFLKASSVLSEKLLLSHDLNTYISPYITVTSLAIELYLKTLYLIEKGTGIAVPRKHNLRKLYGLLGGDSQKFIKISYDEHITKDPITCNIKKSRPDVDLELETVLEEMSEAFVNWRYIFEKRAKGFPAAGPIIRAVRERIRTLCPDWQ